MAFTLRRQATQRPGADSMTLLEHLSELRRRLVISVVAYLVGVGFCYLVYDWILRFLERPYHSACLGAHLSCKLTELAPLQGFTTRLNVAGYGGLIIASPIILYQLWQFVTPGLKANEKRYAFPFVAATIVLFFLGGLAAYAITGRGLKWLLQQGGPGLTSAVSIQSYIDLICILILIFGAAFEFPVLLVALELAGAVSSAALKRVRRFAFLGIVIFSAVITPSSDPFSMMALAIPLTIFYEGSIIVGKLLGK